MEEIRCPSCNFSNDIKSKKCIACNTQLEQEADKDVIEMLFSSGERCFYLGKIEEAIKEWEKIIDIDPSYICVYYHLAMAYKKAGEFEKACICSMAYLEEPEPSREEIIRNLLKRLEKYKPKKSEGNWLIEKLKNFL